jgi:predicted FMN-binding regulatory protein PaiB
MYTPPGFKLDDRAVIKRIVDDNGFATLLRAATMEGYGTHSQASEDVCGWHERD